MPLVLICLSKLHCGIHIRTSIAMAINKQRCNMFNYNQFRFVAFITFFFCFFWSYLLLLFIFISGMSLHRSSTSCSHPFHPLVVKFLQDSRVPPVSTCLDLSQSQPLYNIVGNFLKISQFCGTTLE